MLKIAVGCDPNATVFKQEIVKHLTGKGYDVTDMGSDDEIYANIAIKVSEAVASKQFDRGILFCGTGIGMSIAANKVKGVYAALITDSYSAERACKSNNSNVACMGAFTLGISLAKNLLDIWLACEYTPGTTSEPKVQRIVRYEQGA